MVSRDSRGISLLALAMFSIGCTERVVAPELRPAPIPSGTVAMECQVTVATRALACAPASEPPRAGARFDRIIGGQDVYVKITSANSSYDGGTQLLSADIAVQNLADRPIGTSDGTTVSGVDIFFYQDPTVTGGSGSVTMANADGNGTFTASGQIYYAYPQIVQPYEISATRRWQFSFPPTVTAFAFKLYVSAPLPNEGASLLDRVWAGAGDGNWLSATNWTGGAAPDSGSTASVPTDSLISGAHAQPQLTIDTAVTNLRVGYGAALQLNAHTLRVYGNLDAIGSIAAGTVELRGGNAVVGGNLPTVTVLGRAHLQRPTATTGAVAIVDGTLGVADQPLTIQMP